MNQLFDSLTFFAGADPVSWIVIGAFMVVSAAFSVYSVQQAKKAMQRNIQNRQRGSLYQVRAGALPRRIPYGYVRTGAIDTYVTASGTENQYMHYILIWGEGPIEGVANLLFDGENVDLVPIDEDNPDILIAAPGSRWEGCVRFETSKGDNPVNPATHGQDIIPVWGDVDTNRLLGIAYSWLELFFDEEKFPRGVPNISAILLGRNDIYDPRDDSYKYTNNPALCMNHYLCLPKMGPGLDYATEIGHDELIAAATICEELVSVPASGTGTEGTGPSTGATVDEFRYTFNGVVELSMTAEEIIEGFRTAMAGTTVYIGGKWRMYAGAYQVPTFEITKDHIVGPIKRRTRAGKQERINKVRGVYSSSATLWVPTDFPAVPAAGSADAQYAIDDGEELVEDIDLMNTDSPYRAQRLATILLRKSRYGRTLTIPCNVECWRAQPGLTVYFHMPEIGFEHVPMDVVSSALNIRDKKITVVLSLKETNAYIYDDVVLTEKPDPPPRPTVEPPTSRPPTYIDVLDTADAVITSEFSSRGGDLSLIGFSEFTDEALNIYASTPPKKYRKKTITGELSRDDYYGSFACTQTYQGDGGVAIYFPVFAFWNEYQQGTVSVRLLEVVDGFAYYVTEGMMSAPVDPVWVSGGGQIFQLAFTSGNISLDRIHVGGGFYSHPGGYEFAVPIGTIFGAAVLVPAIYGYGIGAGYYEAGNSGFTDTWNSEYLYDAVTAELTTSINNTRTTRYGETSAVPDRFSGVTLADPLLVYTPATTLATPTEPPYTYGYVLSPIAKKVWGLGCAIGQGTVYVSALKSLKCDSEIDILLDEEEEDTEADAINRMQVTQPWVVAETGPETIYEIRTAGFVFEYIEVKVVVNISELTPSTIYLLKTTFAKTEIATGTVTYTYREELFTTDLEGEHVEEFELPVSRGFRYGLHSNEVILVGEAT